MNLRQLRTLATFLEKGSFAAVGDAIGLSHSAISVQMQRLEEELGIELFDRSTRPPSFTSIGIEIAAQAQNALEEIENIRMIAGGKRVVGSVSIGFVPSTHQTLLPVVLNALREAYPQLRVVVKSGFSGDLAASVIQRELDFAILTSAVTELHDLEITEIASETLYAIGPANHKGMERDAELLRSMPFISFSKATWLGQQIATKLQQRGILVNEVMDIESVDVIEKLVIEGFGVSVVPQRLLAEPLSEELVRVPFCQPVATRELVLIRHARGRASSLEASVRDVCLSLGAMENREIPASPDT
ncbi:MAG: LysR family transcriptional regulator [Alphaproteobacteria bacterium]